MKKTKKNIKIIKTRYTNVIFLCLFSYFLWWEFGKSSFWGDVDNFDAERIVYKISGGARIFLKRDENSDFFYNTYKYLNNAIIFTNFFGGIFFLNSNYIGIKISSKWKFCIGIDFAGL